MAMTNTQRVIHCGIYTSVQEAKSCMDIYPKRALRILNEAEGQYPDNTSVLETKTKVLLKLKRLNEAEKTARRNVDLSYHPRVFGLLARVLFAKAKLDEAEENAFKSAYLSNDPIAFSWLAKILLAKGEFDEAEDAVRKSIELNGTGFAYYILTKILLAKGEFDEAEETAHMAIRLNGSINDYCQLTRVLLAKDNLYDAERVAINAVYMDEKNPIVWLNLAIVLRKQKRYKEALVALGNIKEEDYQKEITSAYCYMHLGKFEKSLDAFIKAESILDKENVCFYFSVRLRLDSGFLFLFRDMSEVQADIPARLQRRVVQASLSLKAFKTKKMGNFQKRDFLKALQITEMYDL